MLYLLMAKSPNSWCTSPMNFMGPAMGAMAGRKSWNKWWTFQPWKWWPEAIVILRNTRSVWEIYYSLRWIFIAVFYMGHGFQFAFCVRLQEGLPTIHELFIHSLADGFSSQFCPKMLLGIPSGDVAEKSHQQSGLSSPDRLPEGKPFFVLVKQCHKRTTPQKKLHFYRWYNN